MLIAVILILVVTGAMWRARHLRAMTALSMAHRTLGPDGVVVGGGPFTRERSGAPAVLLLHGAGDTPQTLRYLADSLYDAGFHVSAPLLPGHGRTIRDFSTVSADALTAASRAAYADLCAHHPWVGIIGLSMGGALAAQLAADNAELPALGLVAPYLAMPRRVERAARLVGIWGPLVPVLASAEGLSILDPVERERSLAYGVFTAAGLRALHETMRRGVDALPQITTPALMVQSREDNRISVADAERAFGRLGAKERRLEWTSGAAHVITVDYGREHVIAMLTSWMLQHHVSR